MTLLKNYTIAELDVGQTASLIRRLSHADVVLFAQCSGDVNPVHLDADYAATTPFGEPIGHGMWLGAVISAAIATVLPGPGSVYRSQTLQFKHPVKWGDEVTVTLKVSEIKERIRLVVLECEAQNQTGTLLARGTAEVIAPAEKLVLPRIELPEISVAGIDEP